MYIPLHSYMHIQTHLCLLVNIHSYMHACIHTLVMYICNDGTSAYMCTYLPSYNVYTCMYSCIHTESCNFVDIYAKIHTYTHEFLAINMHT